MFAIMAYFASLWLGGATSSAAMLSYISGGTPRWIAIGILVLLVISGCPAGVMMLIYSILLLVMNRTALPAAIKVRSYRIVTLVWSTVFFGFMAVLALRDQLGTLF